MIFNKITILDIQVYYLKGRNPYTLLYHFKTLSYISILPLTNIQYQGQKNNDYIEIILI